MIPFEEIDSRLAKAGKDRAWLAENTPYSADYIRTVLAPKSTRRTQRVQEILSAAIEREERQQAGPAPADIPQDVIVIEVDSDRYKNYSESAKDAHQTLKEWAIAELDKAAAEWAALANRANLSLVAEEVRDYGSKPAEGK